ILQLIAKAEGAPRLVEAAPRPKAAGQGLIRQPAVAQHVKRGIWRLNLHGAKAPVSSAPRLPAVPSLKTISRSCPSASSKGIWMAPQGSRPAPTLLDNFNRVIASGLLCVPLRPRNSARSPLNVTFALLVASLASKKIFLSLNSVL